MFKMMEVKSLMTNFAIVAILILQVSSHSSKSSEEKYEYECANKYARYKLDDAPAEYGISVGFYAPGKKAYIGLSIFANMAYQINRLQLNPPGVQLFNAAGPGSFINDTSRIWYLRYSHRHVYRWVDSSNARKEPFAIEVGSTESGFDLYIGRIKKNGLVMLGVVVPFGGVMFYADENGMSHSTQTGYQVLTCKSKKYEEKIPPPPLSVATVPNVDPPNGCVSTWLPYNNDDAPSKNGISAGKYDCGNEAYVGRAKSLGIYLPGRIQITPNSGLYFNTAGRETFVPSNSSYLANNPNYTYSWAVFDGSIPRNAVFVRNDVGNFFMPISRVKLNGHMKIGRMIFPAAGIADENGIDQFFTNSEVLVCDPWPKYQCAQSWKKFNASELPADGLTVDSLFIARGTRKCINGCDYGLGKATAAGVSYIDDLTATEVLDTTTAGEYLVKNPTDTYKWVASRSGVKVPNALELHKEGHRPFYIGLTRINDNVFIGKVRPGEGLFFADTNGKLKSTSSYEVLTCYSPLTDNGLYQEKPDTDWFGSFGCPVRKSWSFTQWRCVCREEYKGIFVASGAKWSDETCSYVSA